LWLWVAGVTFAVIVVAAFRLMTPNPVRLDSELRVAVIDQLSPTFSSQEFRSSILDSVQDFGLPADLYEGGEVDVALYRSLGLKNYGLLVLRSHSGILETGGAEPERVSALFTNEPYSQRKHVTEQLRDRLLIVRPFEDDPSLTFGITPQFVLYSMEGRLPRSVVVVAGCSILGRTDLAQALVARGASVVIAWDRSVGLDHVDTATALLVRHLLSDRMTVERAVVSTILEAGPDPDYGASLRFYPESAGRYTVAELIAGTV
jgi:hypothetical protein